MNIEQKAEQKHSLLLTSKRKSTREKKSHIQCKFCSDTILLARQTIVRKAFLGKNYPV